MWKHLPHQAVKLLTLVPRGDSQGDLIKPQRLIDLDVFHHLLHRAGRHPAFNEVPRIVRRVVEIEELFGLLDRRIPVIVQIDIVIEVTLDASRIPPQLRRLFIDVLQSPGEIISLPLRGLPAIRVLDHAAMGLAHQVPVGSWCVIRDPDRRSRTGGGLWLNRHVLERVLLASEADIVLGPELFEHIGLFLLFLLTILPARAQTVSVGSKKFTESYVLGEIAKKLLEDKGLSVNHRQGIGATGIVWEALKSGAITMYPEYTGTVSEEILKAKGAAMSPESMRAALEKYGVGMTAELGFNNTYALVMRRDKAQKLGIRTITDLQKHSDLRASLSNEFLERKDGWKPLSARYGLGMKNVKGIEHGLAYRALASDQIDLTDAYSTDAGIAEHDLVVLEDDRRFFPQYKAVFLYRLNAPAQAVAAIRTLEGSIDEPKMIRLNAEAEKTKDYTLAASLYFGDEARQTAEGKSASYASRLMGWTRQHLVLVGVSLALAILVGLPLGIVASRPGALSQLILGVTSIIQTIPSLALLALLVPFLGISPATAILALFLYSLLPIVRNTATGLQDIAPPLRESAAALGLDPRAQLVKVFLPMASRTILAGIKTSAVINVGTATIAALIGAGGLGEPIISGLSLNDNATILQGAIPAAILALLVQWGFEFVDRLLIPRGLRLPAARP